MVDAIHGTAADLRRRVDGWRSSERREQALRAQEGPMDPTASLNAAAEMYELWRRVARVDVIRSREVAAARTVWTKLRARMRTDSSHPGRP